MTWLRWFVVLLVVAVPASPAAGSGDDDPVGRDLYLTQCAACHGTHLEGVEGRGPGLLDEGRAAVHFVLETGRMPLAQPYIQPRRGPVRLDGEQIASLVDYVGGLGSGPDIPDVNTDRGDLSRGSFLYRLNCAACHTASGAGAPIGSGREAAPLASVSPTSVGEAIVVGPGAMPVFTEFTPQDIDDVAAYVELLQEENTTGIRSWGGVGPVAEGLAAWLVGLLPIVFLTRWIGSHQEEVGR